MSDLDLFGFGPQPSGEPERSYPRRDRIIKGRPLRQTWDLLDASLQGARVLSSGLWRSEVGEWAIAFGATEREVFTVLEGRCRIRRDDGSHEEAGPGQTLHIPPGFTGSFQVLEPVLKIYVIVE